ncbi:MAG: alpha/beta hydrolase [Burkholderiales bacterium]|nr:alpha/beta hydrolase [Burkholderiales bacterium]
MSALFILAGVFVGLVLLLWWAQEQLIFPAPGAVAAVPAVRGRDALRVQVPVAAGITLAGWLVRPAAPKSARVPLLLYFGGNAEEVTWMAEMADRFPGWALLAVNYRGYGGNPGRPGEAALIADALALHDWAARRDDVDPARIVALGRSLGSGVAVALAAQRRLAGVVLVTPFDSLRDLAQRLYRFIPVDLILRHRFDSLRHAGALDLPLLAIAAERDRVIPPAHARRLYDAWRGPKRWLAIAGADHNDIDASDRYWEAIAAFLAERAAATSGARPP